MQHFDVRGRPGLFYFGKLYYILFNHQDHCAFVAAQRSTKRMCDIVLVSVASAKALAPHPFLLLSGGVSKS